RGSRRLAGRGSRPAPRPGGKLAPEGPAMSAGTNRIAEGALRQWLDQAQSRALAAGGIGLVLSLAAWLLWPDRFLPAYLVAYVFWVGLALGCLGLTMLHHLVGGSWGLVVRRPMESGGMTLLPL